MLRGFGCVEGEYPEANGDISPAKLEEVSGIPIAALTPKERATYWRLAGILVCLSEYAIGEKLGLDPLYTLIPATFAIFLSDQLFLKGAVFETIYQTIFPEYKKKIIYHEAGHFLLAYLLGVPVRDCITSAWEARKNKEIKGQAGTIFYDTKVAEELSKQQISRSSINRLSVIIMAGIAAEATEFGRTEGGIADEQSLISFLNGVQPPWNILRIQGQARWAALQAILLIREHKASYDALVECLLRGAGVGDCVAAIEANLPVSLPAVQRKQQRDAKKKEAEREKYIKYIQTVTRKVGGVERQEGGVNVTVATREEEETALSELDKDRAVAEFTRRIRSLEQAARLGDLNVPSNRGGVWLNDLRSARSPTLDGLASVNIVGGSSGSAEESSASTVSSPDELLASHRGFRIKQLEIDEQYCAAKETEIDARIMELNGDSSSSATADSVTPESASRMFDRTSTTTP